MTTLRHPLYYAGHMYSDENTEITDLVIPDAVTEIKNYAFLGYMGLSSVVIPNSVTKINDFAFYDADNIAEVISYIQEPFGMSGRSADYPTFSKTVFDNAVLWVPKGTIEKYKTTEGWKDFLNIKEINSSSVSAIPSSQLKVYANGDTLYISGANPGELINIYGIDGVCVKTITATNGVVSTPLTNGQTYIVKTMEKTVKIRM